jgi:hypothetical protein
MKMTYKVVVVVYLLKHGYVLPPIQKGGNVLYFYMFSFLTPTISVLKSVGKVVDYSLPYQNIPVLISLFTFSRTLSLCRCVLMQCCFLVRLM